MIECPSCQATYVNNTIFCSECGHYLLGDETQETDLDVKIKVGDKLMRPRAALSAQLGKRPRAIRLIIGDNNREIEMPLDKIIHLGRSAPASNVFPEIDLTDNAGSVKTISRRHARIIKKGSRVFVEDLDSANGTFINGHKLDPYLPEALNDGDILQLGRLNIQVNILTRGYGP
jgi:pSer/pThr/pTyr-binding forkhead associated (FHA) protein